MTQDSERRQRRFLVVGKGMEVEVPAADADQAEKFAREWAGMNGPVSIKLLSEAA